MNEELSDKLDVIIKLLGSNSVIHLEKQNEKILFLHGAGISNNDIAAIVGTSPGTVRKAISRATSK